MGGTKRPGWDVYFIIRGPSGTAEVPNRSNPLERDTLATLLNELAGNLPHVPSLSVETVGIRVEPAEADPADRRPDFQEEMLLRRDSATLRDVRDWLGHQLKETTHTRCPETLLWELGRLLRPQHPQQHVRAPDPATPTQPSSTPPPAQPTRLPPPSPPREDPP